MDFRPLHANELPALHGYVARNPFRLADNSLGFLLMWRPYAHTALAEAEGCLLLRTAYGGKIRFAMARQEPGQFFGTGDLFAAVLLGSLLRGETLSESTARAVDFIQKSVARTLAAGTPMLEGVQFEPLLRELL